MFRYLSYHFINTKIKKYGYSYSLKRFIFQLIQFLMLLFIAGKIYLLEDIYLFILIISGILVFPIIILSQFKYLYNNQRFENMVNYIEKMIIFFKQDPKILNCLQNIRDYIDEKTKELVNQSINILHTDLSDQRYSHALKIINDEYHSSRLVSLHRFMKTVEEQSSLNYLDSLNNLDYDLKEWVNRVYQYQSELKVKKTQFMISLIASILLLAIFSIMWVEVNELTHIIHHTIYQFTAFLFLLCSLLLFTYVQSSITGQWLIEDYNEDDNEKQYQLFIKYKSYSYKRELKHQLIKILIFVCILIYSIYVKQLSVSMISILFIAYLIYEPVKIQKRRKKKISMILSVEFPLWLRDTALNLNNYIVTKAIEHSIDYAHPILVYYIHILLKDIKEDPTSLIPYTSFLKEYNLDLTSFMLSLYSFQVIRHDYIQSEVTDLIKRNQTMLIESEKIRNRNALIGVLVLSFVPILITMIKIFTDMMIMLMGIFSYLGGS